MHGDGARGGFAIQAGEFGCGIVETEEAMDFRNGGEGGAHSARDGFRASTGGDDFHDGAEPGLRAMDFAHGLEAG